MLAAISSIFGSNAAAMLATVEDATYIEKSDLIKEMEIMKDIGQHTNLRGLLGCCTQSGKYWLFNQSN